MKTESKAGSVDQYIQLFPVDMRRRLEQVRDVVRQAVPGGEERISYGMPAMFHHGVVVYYAAFKKHIGLFPPVWDPAVRARAARFAGPKGNLQFPNAEPLPLDVIDAVARSRLADNLAGRARRSARAPKSTAVPPNADV